MSSVEDELTALEARYEALHEAHRVFLAHVWIAWRLLGVDRDPKAAHERLGRALAELPVPRSPGPKRPGLRAIRGGRH